MKSSRCRTRHDSTAKQIFELFSFENRNDQLGAVHTYRGSGSVDLPHIANPVEKTIPPLRHSGQWNRPADLHSVYTIARYDAAAVNGAGLKQQRKAGFISLSRGDGRQCNPKKQRSDAKK